MAAATFRVRHWRWINGERVQGPDLEFPVRTGDEPFDFLCEFAKRTGGAIPDPARDRRWVEVMAKRKKEGRE